MSEGLDQAVFHDWLNHCIQPTDSLISRPSATFKHNQTEIIDIIRSNLYHGSPQCIDKFHLILEHQIISLIYGSNLIETAGTNLDETIWLCQAIFQGEDISQQIKAQPNTENKYRRLEVVNHALALDFMVQQVVLLNMDITEDMILKVHKILSDGMVTEKGLIPGAYRVDEVAVRYGNKKKSVCLRASAVPIYMRDFVYQLKIDMKKVETTKVVDPYALAARYHHQFAMIHPFLDGNGRISRIILNTILLKYAGHLVSIGMDEEEKLDYLQLVRLDAKVFHAEDNEMEFSEQRFHLRFAEFVFQKSINRLEDILDWISDEVIRRKYY